TFKIRNKCPGAPGSFTANGNFITLPLKTEAIIEDINVFPNPAIDFITILNANEPTTLSIYSYNGELVGTYQINGELTINIGHLSNGIYRFYFQELSIAKTIIILH
ncbi:MAG TPA: T9SS type A sorting domain-containing protein, partial [Chitinophagales bacterium]|nr:T9SS type A sorting domain-containing protein [Chitinophagales bacterium]